ncbi:hypothetical protein FSP39_010816 [Pinctada imbricata]|uniref:BTB domain-containing protein n=1 Tax=Pinctada imbricata TaxID=66713 RepID=A0AA88XF92_PINIB|nr:hypothetical protein FSP39_010816 [Pinctada imbricata]
MAEGGSGPVDWRQGKDVLQCNKYMLENGTGADVTLVVGKSKKAIKAHRSKALYDKLSTSSSAELQIPDVEPDIMDVLLKSMYYNMNKVTQVQASAVLAASLRYNLYDLAATSSEMVKDSITHDNVFSILAISYTNTNRTIKEKALEFIYKNSQRCFGSEHFKNLPMKCVEDLLKSDKINLKAERIYESVMNWAEAECLRQGRTPDVANKKTVCGAEILKAIRFVEMDAAYFMQNISRSGLLSPAEEIDIIHVILDPSKRQPQVTETSTASTSAATSSPPGDTEHQTSAKAIEMEEGPAAGTFTRSLSANMGSSAVEMESGDQPRSMMAISGAGAEKTLPPRSVIPGGPSPRPQGAHPVPHDVHLGVGRNGGQKIEIQRFKGVLSGKAYMRDNHDGISFISNRKIKLHGIYVYGSHQVRGKYNITIKILEDKVAPNDANIVLQKATPIKVVTKEIDTDGVTKQYLVEVNPPQVLKADILYTLDMLMKGPVSFYGRSGQDFVLDDDSGVMLSFAQYELALGGTNVEIGQLPGMVIEDIDF